MVVWLLSLIKAALDNELASDFTPFALGKRRWYPLNMKPDESKARKMRYKTFVLPLTD
jgi:hypothetical protein